MATVHVPYTVHAPYVATAARHMMHEDPFYSKYQDGLYALIKFIRSALPWVTHEQLMEYILNIGHGGGRTGFQGLGYDFSLPFKDAIGELYSVVESETKNKFRDSDSLRDVFGLNQKHLAIMRRLFSTPI